MTTATVSISPQGQITLPISIRKQLPTSTLVMQFNGEEIRMKSVDLNQFFSNDDKNFDQAASSEKNKQLFTKLSNIL
ncbi:hypothetical protein COB57_05185 [Candidatus Peregrinibacteria bacterium]|nr:MAG: hypothetical protein COB57_05185 [Candidatus Peregrinibacteria bacterium]